MPQGNAAALVAHKVTATVPIVTIGDDLVGVGLAESLPHPGGNVTGIEVQAVEIRPKWLEILKAVAPNVRSVAVLGDANETPGVLKLEDMSAAFRGDADFPLVAAAGFGRKPGRDWVGAVRRPDRQ